MKPEVYLKLSIASGSSA